MAKAMLIIDMPKCCADCPAFGIWVQQKGYCRADEEERYCEVDVLRERASFCPLMELPEEK